MSGGPTTPHRNCNYDYTTLITPHYNDNSTTHTTTTTLLTTPHHIQQLWVRWPLQPLQPLYKTQLQPPFRPSVDSLCHPRITTTHLSYSVLSWKLPPPPCAVLLVVWCNNLICLMLLQCDRSSHTSGPKENILSHLSLIEEPCATWRHNQPYEVWNPIHPPGWLIWS